MRGHRVKSIEAITDPGDYCVVFAEDGGIKALWFALPNRAGSMWNRIAGEGYGAEHTHGGAEPEWKIRVEEDGSVTVEPSINAPGEWHGWLRAGEWSDA